LTFQRRLLTLWAWLMVLPLIGFLPQISQTCAIGLLSRINQNFVCKQQIVQDLEPFRQPGESLGMPG
jgi:hypothetical protein